MTNLPPRCGSAAVAVTRAAVSMPAPAATGTMTRIGRLGNEAVSCARAVEQMASNASAAQNRILAAAMTVSPGSREPGPMLSMSYTQCNGGIVNWQWYSHAPRVVERQIHASPRFRASGLRPASRDAGLDAVLAAERQSDLYHRPAWRRAAPVGASAGQRHLRLSSGQRKSALDRPAAGRSAAHGRPWRAVSRIRLERQGAVGAPPCRPAS